MRARSLVLAAYFAACSEDTATGPDVALGPSDLPLEHARAVPPGLTDAGADREPPIAPDDPREGPIGRVPHRLDVAQLRAALSHATGASWREARRVRSNEDPSGYLLRENLDMLQYFSGSLGEPDYLSSTEVSLETTMTFARLSADAARHACDAGLTRDRSLAPGDRVLLVGVEATDRYRDRPAAVRANLLRMARRFWTRALRPDDPSVDDLERVFLTVSEAPGGTPLDGWRAACVALATDPQFLLY